MSSDSDKPVRFYITTTSGLRGYFAVMVAVYKDGVEEPWQTSPLSFSTGDGARRDAKSWARDEELPCVDCDITRA